MTDLIKVTLVRSYYGRPPKHRRILKALGLTRMNKTVEKKDNPAIRGMTDKVSHLVRVEEKQ
ncbi:MAG: 50S ribosomal protein L30 [Desulfobacteraceae bacterium]|nr:50S ribosomal protein L30 [Desulfobacteraceae bacterium]MCF8093873.1 50S ribosomal protein L30 [Desulfobacteraceae bacterium]